MTADFSISVVIPTLNASGSLQVTVASLLARPKEILVIDGGSADKTVEIASSAGARVIEAEQGRGLQLKRGGEAATGQWLYFCIPTPGLVQTGGNPHTNSYQIRAIPVGPQFFDLHWMTLHPKREG